MLQNDQSGLKMIMVKDVSAGAEVCMIFHLVFKLELYVICIDAMIFCVGIQYIRFDG